MSLKLGGDALSIQLTTSDEHPVRVEAVGSVPVSLVPLVEILVLGEGRSTNQTRTLISTSRGQLLRYAGHHVAKDGSDVVEQFSADGALEVRTRIRTSDRSLAFRTTVTNSGDSEIVVESATAAALPIPFAMRETMIATGCSSWCAENRWRLESLEEAGLIDCSSERMPLPGSASIARVGTSTWTTDGPLPVGALEDASTGQAVAWQISGGGPWRWELDSFGTEPGHFLLAASGATNLDHAWSTTLAPGASMTTPELVIAASNEGWQGAIQELTRHRRADAARRTSRVGRTALVFNDYMNTIKADPTDEKLLPLIASAARAGAEIYCIDAGWYDDSGDWWPTVGEWLPSTRRFGRIGLQGVLDAIREQGMTPGLWLEPEVVGVRSALVDQLPQSAFLRRRGELIVEHGRYFLNLTSPAARAHLDATFERLIGMGTGYFKLDYNVTPGSGDDSQGQEPGDGLRDHIAAYFEWFDALRQRYPLVVFENCASGAMRQDWAQVSRFDLQSTSDQQDYLLYPPIATGAPMMLLPEQSGNWAYAQPEMSDEVIAFVHVTGLSGRPYYSGHLDHMTDAQLGLVREAAEVWKSIREQSVESVPFWPSGLPAWSADRLALGLRCPDGGAYVSVWNRAESSGTLELELPADLVAGDVQQIYPANLPGWTAHVSPDGRRITGETAPGPSARFYRIDPVA